MSSRKTTGVKFDLVPVAITATGNQRTTCFPQITHYTPAFVAAHRRRSLLTPAVRNSSKSQNWITHRPAALCSCHSVNPLHASGLKQGPSSTPDFTAAIPPAEPVVTNIDIVTGSRMNCRVTTVEGLPRGTGLNSSLTGFQGSIIEAPLPGVASSARQDTIPVSPGINHNMNTNISLETRRLQTQQTGVLRHRPVTSTLKAMHYPTFSIHSGGTVWYLYAELKTHLFVTRSYYCNDY